MVSPLGSACERYMKIQLFGPVGLMKYPVMREIALTRSLRGGYFYNWIKTVWEWDQRRQVWSVHTKYFYSRCPRNDAFKDSRCYVPGSVWRSWHTGCLTEKLTIVYSSFITCHERSVTTSLFFIGFGQSPAEKKDKDLVIWVYRLHSLVQCNCHNFRLNKSSLLWQVRVIPQILWCNKKLLILHPGGLQEHRRHRH